jgi:hypothetical protein
MKINVNNVSCVGLSLFYLIIPMHFVLELTKIEKDNSSLEKIKRKLTFSIYFFLLLKEIEVKLKWEIEDYLVFLFSHSVGSMLFVLRLNKMEKNDFLLEKIKEKLSFFIYFFLISKEIGVKLI